MRQYPTPDMQPCGQYVPDYFLHDNDNRDETVERYYDAPPDPGTPATVTRHVSDPRPFVRVCSTYNPKVPVTMPRVRFIDGPYAVSTKEAA